MKSIAAVTKPLKTYFSFVQFSFNTIYMSKTSLILVLSIALVCYQLSWAEILPPNRFLPSLEWMEWKTNFHISLETSVISCFRHFGKQKWHRHSLTESTWLQYWEHWYLLTTSLEFHFGLISVMIWAYLSQSFGWRQAELKEILHRII